ncbi:hypothetical protein LBMAG53_20920 [Planctomycetota bacterium]|nr:hypothetical protein LBMAG53_20920 [Planctomycetota bacterium]
MSTFFGIQMVLDLPQRHLIRERLARCVRTMRKGQNHHEQRAAWLQVATVMTSTLPMLVLGNWEFVRKRGSNEFTAWKGELEAMAGWSNHDFQGAEQVPDDLLLVTVIFLIQAGSNADLALGDRCDLPESDWYQRVTFGRLIAGVWQLNHLGVHDSAMYLAPNPDRLGFSRSVLVGGEFPHLRPITAGKAQT